MDNKVSVVIPCYNEENSISATIAEVHTALIDIEHEIIVVDDGSTDATYEIAKKMDCCIIKHDFNKGYGASLKTGIRYAKYPIIAITDADKTYPNQVLPKLLKHMETYDMVVGARTGKNVNISLIRKPAKWFLNILANYLTGVKIPDLNSGLRVFKKEIVENYWGIFPDGFSFTTTITLLTLSNNYLVKYVPIDYYKREGKSKIRPIADTINFFNLIIRTILYFKPLKIFFPLFLFLILIGFSVFFYSWLILNRVMDITVIVILLSSVQILSIGLIADVIVKRSGFK